MNRTGYFRREPALTAMEPTKGQTKSAACRYEDDEESAAGEGGWAAGSEAWTIVAATLERLGAQHVFGLPGTQNTLFYEAMRRAGINAIVPTSETAAAFMAGAYYRVSGQPGVLTTIQGPGLAYALTGLAEARLDSAAVVYLLNASDRQARHGFDLQSIDQRALLEPLTKTIVTVAAQQDIEAALSDCWRTALAGEPGPVVLELDLNRNVGNRSAITQSALKSPDVANNPSVAAAWKRIAQSKKPVLLAGQGALGSHKAVRALAEQLPAPLLTTPSARGLIPENEPLAMGFDVVKGSLDAANALLDEADLVIVLGAKLGHNGSAGFAMELPPDKVLRIDTSQEALTTVYPAHQTLQMDVGAFLAAPESNCDFKSSGASNWTDATIRAHRSAIRALCPSREPMVVGVEPAKFMSALRGSLPEHACLVTDTGLHQVMTRRHLDITTPRGLLMPSDFQSMGFGIPAAIAARLADMSRPVIALVGDGSFRMNGFELGTAVREKIALTVMVFNDGSLNQIRQQQLTEFGVTSGTDLGPIAFDAFAAAVGADYACVANLDDLALAMDKGIGSTGVMLIEVLVGDTMAIRSSAMIKRAKHLAQSALGDKIARRIKSITKKLGIR